MTDPAANSPRMHFSAGNCVCGSRSRVTAPATTPCCWPRRRRRVPGDRVVDFGAGVGAAGLAVAKRVAGIELVLVEIDAALAGLARGNAASNAIAADVIVLDVTSAADAFAAAGPDPRQRRCRADESAVQRSRAAPRLAGQGREIAHVATAATLESWIHAARRILKSGGVLTLIWRADGLAEVLAALDRGFGSLAILPVHGDADDAGDPRADSRHQGRQGADANACRADAQ